MVGSKELTDRVVEQCRSDEEDFELKQILVEFVQEADGVNETEALSRTESLIDEVVERLQNRKDRRERRGEPVEYDIIHDYVQPKPTSDIDEIRGLLNKFEIDDGWDNPAHRNRNFETLVGGFLLSSGATEVQITQYNRDGGYDVSGIFELKSDSVTVARVPFKAEARNKSDTVAVEEISSLGDLLETGELGFYVSRCEEYSLTQRTRPSGGVNTVTVGQLIQATRDDPDLEGFLVELTPPTPAEITMSDFDLDRIDTGHITESG